MSWGGFNAYKKPLIPWGGRMRSSLKLPKSAKGAPELLRGVILSGYPSVGPSVYEIFRILFSSLCPCVILSEIM